MCGFIEGSSCIATEDNCSILSADRKPTYPRAPTLDIIHETHAQTLYTRVIHVGTGLAPVRERVLVRSKCIQPARAPHGRTGASPVPTVFERNGI
jgi:hypothetical protein